MVRGKSLLMVYLLLYLLILPVVLLLTETPLGEDFVGDKIVQPEELKILTVNKAREVIFTKLNQLSLIMNIVSTKRGYFGGLTLA